MLLSPIDQLENYAPTVIEQPWRALRILNYYRLCLAVVFIFLLLLFEPSPSRLGYTRPSLFYAASMVLLILGAVSAYLIRIRQPGFKTQVNLQILSDILILTTITHASGGVSSGLGVLIVIVVAFGSLIRPGKYAILYSSFATLSILAESTYTHLTSASMTPTYTQAGLLGIAFFATAFISLLISRRLTESQALIRQREVDLANMEQLNDYIIQNLHSGIIVVDRHEKIRLINDSAACLLGVADTGRVTGQPLSSVSATLTRQLQAWQQDRNYNPSAFQRADDSAELLPRFATLGTRENTGTIIFLEDSVEVTQKLQQVKLAALGRLTASIAHEIRNPLGAISHAAQLLEESPELAREDLRLTEIIHHHSNRMNKIIENVLSLSKRENTYPLTLKLHDWLLDFRQDFCASAGCNPRQIQIDIQPKDIRVSIDPSHLHQILFNLCQNALIHGSHNDDTKPLVILRGGISGNTRAPYLDVLDYGPGITPENRQKIFEPFFTTATSGTGLGLYITRELCEYNKTRLNYIESNENGSCFRISFTDPERLKL